MKICFTSKNIYYFVVIKAMSKDDLKAQLHGSQFWRQFFLKSASRFQYSNLIGCIHANYDVIVNILGVRYLENRRTRFRATAPLILHQSHVKRGLKSSTAPFQ